MLVEKVTRAIISKKASALLIICLAVVIYSNSLTVPFVFDDIPNIVDNKQIRDLSNFFSQTGLNHHRLIGDFTFALNYMINDLDVTGYHLFNLLIHIINGFLILGLTSALYKTIDRRCDRVILNIIATMAAIFFVVHPVQTQAVTYIVQRYASLATTFYLFSIFGFIKWKNSNKKRWYILSLVSAVLGVKTKEICFTIPFMILLIDSLFYKDRKNKRLPYVIPYFLVALLIPLSFINLDAPVGNLIGDISKVTAVSKEISRLDYLITEFRVMATYLRLIVLPVNQNLDYFYPVKNSFFDLEVILSLSLVLSLILYGVYLVIKKRDNPFLRVIGFGILWFFITISVESSIIPIPDVINEHRLYLPIAGASMSIASLLGLIQKRDFRLLAMIGFIIVVMVFSIATYRRNSVWQSEISLWEDVVKKSPYNPRAYNNLGQAYSKYGLIEKSIQAYKRSIELRPDHAGTHYNLGNSYLAAGKYDLAISEYNRAIKLDKDFVNAMVNLAVAYKRRGDIKKAIDIYRKILEKRPDFAVVHYNLANAYYELGNKKEALKHYKIAERLMSSINNKRRY